MTDAPTCPLCGCQWWCCGETMCPQPKQPKQPKTGAKTSWQWRTNGTGCFYVVWYTPLPMKGVWFWVDEYS